jgi:hypothetical protein
MPPPAAIDFATNNVGNGPTSVIHVDSNMFPSTATP